MALIERPVCPALRINRYVPDAAFLAIVSPWGRYLTLGSLSAPLEPDW